MTLFQTKRIGIFLIRDVAQAITEALGKIAIINPMHNIHINIDM